MLFTKFDDQIILSEAWLSSEGVPPHWRKCSNEILPGVDLQILSSEMLEWNSTRGRYTNSISGRIGRLVYFVWEFVCRDFIGRCRWLVFVIARFCDFSFFQKPDPTVSELKLWAVRQQDKKFCSDGWGNKLENKEIRVMASSFGLENVYPQNWIWNETISQWIGQSHWAVERSITELQNRRA